MRSTLHCVFLFFLLLGVVCIVACLGGVRGGAGSLRNTLLCVFFVVVGESCLYVSFGVSISAALWGDVSVVLCSFCGVACYSHYLLCGAVTKNKLVQNAG